MTKLTSDTASAIQLRRSLSEMEPLKRAELVDRILVATKLIEEIKRQAKELIKANPDAIPGYSLGKPRVTETVTNPQEVFNRFSAIGGSLEQFMGCITVGKTKLKEQVAGIAKVKGKALESKMEELTVGCVESKESEPSIVKSKESK